MISKKTQDFYSFFTSLFSILPRLQSSKLRKINIINASIGQNASLYK